MELVRIVGLTGSLREKSYNKMALKEAMNLLPSEAVLEIIDLSTLPFFNQDMEKEKPLPEVMDFLKNLASADAFLISTPEYNFSIPPVLKNALDWASRVRKGPLSGKPLAIMSVSIGKYGGLRAQYHLRQVCVSLDMRPLNKPEIFITKAADKFDENGNLIDNVAKEGISRLLKNLVNEVINTK